MGRVSLGGDDIKSAILMRGETTGQGQCVGPLQLLVNVLLCYCATVPLEDPGSQLTAHGKGCSAVVRVQQPSMSAWY